MGGIQQLLEFRADPTRDCGAVNALLDQQIERIQEQMASLRMLEQQLIGLRQQCGDHQQARDCGILKNLSEPQTGGEKDGCK